MPPPYLVELLAEIPRGAVYISPLKLILIFLLFTGWVLFAQWVDKDTIRVNTFRNIWNMITMGLGAVTLFVMLLAPFEIGVPVYAVANGGLMIAYVIHRNGLVMEEDKVMTAAHIKRLLSGQGRKPKLMDVKERVRLTTPDRKHIELPEDQAGRQQFAFAQDILFDALWRRSGEIMIVPAGQQASRVRLVIDGIPVDREPIARADGDSFLQFMKKAAGLNLEERRKPQRGKLNAQIGETKFELVVKSTGSTAGESLTIHVVGPEKSFKVSDLGFTEAQLASFKSLMFAEKGLIVVTAPPGHGLTTTVYAIARSHDAFLQSIQLIETEREMEVDNITQKLYANTEEAPFQAELLKIFRSDPNVVLVPEPRDKASAVVLSEGAARKQIVYSSLPTADIFDGLQKWIERVSDPALVAKSLVAITHQRLVRKLCTNCKAAYKPDPATLQKINMPADKLLYRPPEPQYDKHGNPIICQGCQGTGYVGRVGVFVVLTIDDELRAVIKRGQMAEILAAAKKKGGLSIQQAALQKVFDGVTSIDEIVRATRPAAPAKPKPTAAPAAAAAKPAGGATAKPTS